MSDAPPPPVPKRSPVRTIILIVLALLLILFSYTVLSDRFTPYTSHARVDTFLVQIAPEVSGRVISVEAKENSHVTKGQVIFRIDPEPFEIALSAARANLVAALQDAQVAEADVTASSADVTKRRVDLDATRKLGKIVTDLVAQRALPKTNEIRAVAEIGKSKADVEKSEADLKRARANLGEPGYSNSKVRQAVEAVNQAKLDLKNTIVVAAADGIVTNLLLTRGQYVSKGQPLLSFLADGPRWISADMRENQLGNIRAGDDVTVALDVRPGKLFPARVHSIGFGIQQSDQTPTGQLPDIPPDQGWLREPQRFPVRVQLLPTDSNAAEIVLGRSGAQANVIVFTSKHSVLNPIGRLWIKVISLLSYLR